ncbi:MAG: hypothetical protein K0R29_2404, partial [Pseudobdellovibrio sp.]|nr:hypothetical protein [Pseudobdellovibrio sp.]
MSLNFKLYLVAFLSFVVADTIWIGFVMKNFYTQQMINFGRIFEGKFEPLLWAALIVYLVLSIGVVDFVLPKLAADSNLLSSFLTGALLGLVVYGTYDFTNLATVKDYSLTLTFVDVGWGMFVTGLASAVT